MSQSKLPFPLRGIVPPMITPLRERDSLDRPGLERLVEHILAGGVSGLFILGSTGEAAGLSHRLQRELIESVCAQVGDRVPVLVGITAPCFGESIELASVAARAGASAVVAAPPGGPFRQPHRGGRGHREPQPDQDEPNGRSHHPAPCQLARKSAHRLPAGGGAGKTPADRVIAQIGIP